MEDRHGGTKIFGLLMWRGAYRLISGEEPFSDQELGFWLITLGAAFLLSELEFWDEVLKPTFRHLFRRTK